MPCTSTFARSDYTFLIHWQAKSAEICGSKHRTTATLKKSNRFESVIYWKQLFDQNSFSTLGDNNAKSCHCIDSSSHSMYWRRNELLLFESRLWLELVSQFKLPWCRMQEYTWPYYQTKSIQLFVRRFVKLHLRRFAHQHSCGSQRS